ncbi:MAG: hypothetical protein WCR95_04480 [Eubacteriales bacterium]
MRVKNPKIKNVVYLIVLCMALVFSLYNLFSENAKSWFVSNKSIDIGHVYGRVITTGAGRSLASYKNEESDGIHAMLVEGWEGDPSYLIMVPGDIIHFIFLVALPDPAAISDSILYLNDIYGDQALRSQCVIYENTVKISKVSCEEVEEDGLIKYIYSFDEVWQTLPNQKLSSLATLEPDIGFEIGEVSVDGEIVDVGAYAGQYAFLLDIPLLYLDIGENQNSQKCEYTVNIEGDYIPVPDSAAGRIEIARCSFVSRP